MESQPQNQEFSYNFYGKSTSKSGILKFSNTISKESLPQKPEFSNTISLEICPKIWNSQIPKYNFYGKSASKSGLLKFSNTISMERLPLNPEFSNTISMESQPQNLEFSNSQIQFLCKVSLNIRNSHILKYNIYGKSASISGILIFSNTIFMESQP